MNIMNIMDKNSNHQKLKQTLKTKDSISNVVQEIKKAPTSKCPFCGDNNDTNATFCDNCGKQLNKTCPSCNFKNKVNAKYCSNWWQISWLIYYYD